MRAVVVIIACVLVFTWTVQASTAQDECEIGSEQGRDPSCFYAYLSVPPATVFGDGWELYKENRPSSEYDGSSLGFYVGPRGSRIFVRIAFYGNHSPRNLQEWQQLLDWPGHLAERATNRVVELDVTPSEDHGLPCVDTHFDQSADVRFALSFLFPEGRTACLTEDGVIVDVYVIGEYQGEPGLDGSIRAAAIVLDYIEQDPVLAGD